MAYRDSQTGQYNETYPLEAFVHALERLGGDVGTKDVEQAVGCEYRTAISKLHELEDKGVASSRRVGNAYLWSLADSSEMGTSGVEPEARNDESTQEDATSSSSSGPYDPLDEWE